MTFDLGSVPLHKKKVFLPKRLKKLLRLLEYETNRKNIYIYIRMFQKFMLNYLIHNI